MTKEEFLALCAAHASGGGEPTYCVKRYAKDLAGANFIRIETTGGMSGGSCWGNTPSHYTSEVADPGIGPALDSFLEAHFPSVSFMRYRRLFGLVKVRETGESEYYGNSTDFSVWYLSFEDAWSVLEDEAGKS